MQETAHSIWLKDAAAKGNAQAAFEYGRWMLRRAATPDDEQTGRDYVRRAAEGGYLPAIYDEIVFPLYHGANNPEKLAEWFRFAIDRNSGSALVRFIHGFLMYRPHFWRIPANPRRVRIGIRMCYMLLDSPQAAAMNCFTMARMVWRLSESDRPWAATPAKSLLRRLAAANGADFCIAMADFLDWSTGRPWSDSCERHAYLWWKRAAEFGHVEALFRLGLCYATGSGTRRNAPRGAEFLAQAASQGHEAAADVLSEMGWDIIDI